MPLHWFCSLIICSFVLLVVTLKIQWQIPWENRISYVCSFSLYFCALESFSHRTVTLLVPLRAGIMVLTELWLMPVSCVISCNCTLSHSTHFADDCQEELNHVLDTTQSISKCIPYNTIFHSLHQCMRFSDSKNSSNIAAWFFAWAYSWLQIIHSQNIFGFATEDYLSENFYSVITNEPDICSALFTFFSLALQPGLI